MIHGLCNIVHSHSPANDAHYGGQNLKWEDEAQTQCDVHVHLHFDPSLQKVHNPKEQPAPLGTSMVLLPPRIYPC